MSRKLLLAAVVSVASLTTLAVAQNNPNGGGNQQGQGQGGGGGRGNWDPAQMQQRMMERIKEQLKAPDDEWTVISPKLEAVMKAQGETRAGGFGGRGGRGQGGGGGGGGQPQGEVAKASQELRSTLEAENASPETVAAKLKAYRDARAKAEESLKAARAELKGVLTERQEAVLVMAGMLE